MNNFPRVNFTYSYFLDEMVTTFSLMEPFPNLKHFKKLKYGEILTEEETFKKYYEIKKAWKEHELNIFKTMYEITGLSFQRNVLDVYVVNITPRVFSKPIIIPAKPPTEQHLRTLTHEFLHILIEESLGKNKIKLEEILNVMFPNEKNLTISHIPIYAILALIYKKVFPERNFLELDKLQTKNHTTNEYSRAISLAEEYGFEKLINDIKIKLKEV